MANINADVIRVEAADEATLTSTLREKMFGIALDTNRAGWKKTGGSMSWYWDTAALANASASTSGAEKVGMPGITGVTPDGGSSGASGNVYTMLLGLKAYIDAAPAAAVSGSGTVGYIPMFTNTDEIGDSLLWADGNVLYWSTNVSDLSGLLLYNASSGTNAIASLILSADGGNANIYTAASTYTGYLEAAARLNIFVNATLSAGINFNVVSTTGTIDYYFGGFVDDVDPSFSMSAKLLSIQNISLTTDVDETVGGLSITTAVEKNDSNTRTFYIQSIKPTLNTGGSNNNTTINLLDIDTTNTGITGLAVNLLKASYGGTELLRVDSLGDITSSSTGFEIKMNDDSSRLYLCGGSETSSSTGAFIILNGITASDPGAVRIFSGASTGHIDMLGHTRFNGPTTYFDVLSTPASPDLGDVNVYLKGSIFVFQFNDSSTIRYKYLDLAGTGTTWTHSTSAP